MKALDIALLLFLILLPQLSIAQCPLANSCTPGSAPSSSFIFGMGIYNVTVGSGATGFSNPTTGGASDGYQNYSCTKKATVFEGAATSISVTTNPNANENVRVWLDLNNNGIFETGTELIFSSTNAKIHAGSFTIPISATVVKNTVLRMRVAADNFSSPIPSPCSSPVYSQVEDYGITVVVNTNKPAVDFSVNNPITCSPMVQFQDLTQNGATSYLWDFGDGTTSSVMNPSHTYTATGTYTVKLKACNAIGCDSVTKTDYVNYHTNVPVAASCTPTVTSYCCGYGINNFTFHTLTNTSQVGNAGYEDFTCTKSVYVMESNTYPVSVTASATNPQNVWVYIDYNNDGTFTSNELVFTKAGTVNPTGTVTIQPKAVKNRPLRMRVIADSQGGSSGLCTILTSGQVEDYTVIILPNTNRPAASFSSDYLTLCDTLVQFADNSLNAPTSWLWDFGDGSPKSQMKYPQHTYSTTGVYTVKLVACNINGCDSITKNQYIYIKKPCPLYCIPPPGSASSTYIAKVEFNTLLNNSGAAPNGYIYYPDITTNVIKGRLYTINCEAASQVYTDIHVWIDYNQNGFFDEPTEKVATWLSSSVVNKNIRIPYQARSGPTRMRISVVPRYTPVSSCSRAAETEDYIINILPNTPKPTALFTTFSQGVCNYTVAFTDTSTNSPDTWSWNFGDPASGAANTSSLQDPNHTFSGPGTYTISLTVCNKYGCSTITKSNYITVLGNQGPKSISCRPATVNPNPNSPSGCYSFILNTINNISGGSGYEDFSCSQQTVLVQGNSYPFSVDTGPQNALFVKIWIDFNNDAVFNPVTELVYASSSSLKLHTGNIVIPTNAVLDVPLRLRISADYNYTYPGPCDPAIYGQIEDYAVTIIANAGKPVASFYPSSYSSCNPLITFTDQSIDNPTSWSWNFGDAASGAANTSNFQNPAHTFSGTGNYAVTLTACNAAGCHTINKVVSIIAQPVTVNRCPHSSAPNVSGEGIYNVRFLTVNHSSGNSSEGYQDFSCVGNAITKPGSFLVTVQTNPNSGEYAKAFIDLNGDGDFSDSWEEVPLTTTNGRLHTGLVKIPATAVKNTWLKFRIVDLASGGSSIYVYPCVTNSRGQAEDYAIMIKDNIDMITNIVGLKESEGPRFADQLQVYPNPNSGKFFLEIPAVFKGTIQVEVYNLIGQKVLAQELSETDTTKSIDLSQAPKGVYVLKIFNAERTVVKKVVIE